MKTINKQIAKVILEIMFCVVLIIGSYFIWDNLEINKYAAYAANSHNIPTLSIVEAEPIIVGELIPISDDAANSAEGGILRIDNGIVTPKDYEMMLLIDKNSTLDYKLLTVSINNNVYKLKDLDAEIEDSHIVISLFEDTINGSKDYNVKMWLNETAGNEAMNKTIIYQFYANENHTEIALN